MGLLSAQGSKGTTKAGTSAFSSPPPRLGPENQSVRRCYTRSPGRAGTVGGDDRCSAPARLSARGAGPDVTLVRAAAHGLPDALSPALRGRGARGAAAAPGRGVGRDGTASAALAWVGGPRFAFCSSATIYLVFLSFFFFLQF